MAFFKQKIDFGQFVGEAISNSIKSYDANADKWIPMADESNVLNDAEKAELKELGYSLVIADLIVSCGIHFKNKVSSEAISYAVSFLYMRFLKEVKQLTENDIEKQKVALEKLINKATEQSEKIYEKHNLSADDNLKVALASAFAELYAGDDYRSEKAEDKRFAAFKFAKGIVKVDLVGLMLKEYKVQNWPQRGNE